LEPTFGFKFPASLWPNFRPTSFGLGEKWEENLSKKMEEIVLKEVGIKKGSS